jgi:cell wall-associated NlpC family hydrolase
MYVGNGDMIDAPTTGQDVQIQPIFSGFSYGRRLSG